MIKDFKENVIKGHVLVNSLLDLKQDSEVLWREIILGEYDSILSCYFYNEFENKEVEIDQLSSEYLFLNKNIQLTLFLVKEKAGYKLSEYLESKKDQYK